jgi:iron(III) transport system permease protein
VGRCKAGCASGWGITGLPEMRSRAGVIVVMSLALYPYVYLITKNALPRKGAMALEAAQSLGLSRTRFFLRVALPMARPWIAAGLMLALMETLADFGTVAVFNYDTFTTAIYKAWYSLFSLPAAAQLASVLIVFVLIVVVIEQRSRAQMRFGAVGRGAASRRIVLLGMQRWLAFGYAAGVLLLAFVIPVTQLLLWTWDTAARDLDARYWSFTLHSLMLSALGAMLVVAVALLLAYAGRKQPGSGMVWTQRVATLGYAFPGAVLAVGLFIPVAALDNVLIDLDSAGLALLAPRSLRVLCWSCCWPIWCVFWRWGSARSTAACSASPAMWMRLRAAWARPVGNCWRGCTFPCCVPACRPPPP